MDETRQRDAAALGGIIIVCNVETGTIVLPPPPRLQNANGPTDDLVVVQASFLPPRMSVYEGGGRERGVIYRNV